MAFLHRTYSPVTDYKLPIYLAYLSPPQEHKISEGKFLIILFPDVSAAPERHLPRVSSSSSFYCAPTTAVRTLHILSDPHNNPATKYYRHHPHFIGGETEAQMDSGTCPRFHADTLQSWNSNSIWRQSLCSLPPPLELHLLLLYLLNN